MVWESNLGELVTSSVWIFLDIGLRVMIDLEESWAKTRHFVEIFKSTRILLRKGYADKFSRKIFNDLANQ